MGAHKTKMTKEERIAMLKKELAELEGETTTENESLKLKKLKDECATLNANQVPVISFNRGTKVHQLWLKTYGYKNIETFATTMECLKALIESDIEDFTRKDLYFINKTWFPTLNAGLERFEVATTVENYNSWYGYEKKECEPYIKQVYLHSDKPSREMIAKTFNETFNKKQSSSYKTCALIPSTIECFKTIVTINELNTESHTYENVTKEVSVLRYHYNKEVLKNLYTTMRTHYVNARELITRTNDEIARLTRKRKACEKIVNLCK